MKKSYKVDVNCASCANKMENEAKKIKGIKDVMINFMTLKMKVSFEDDISDIEPIMDNVVKSCKKIESDFQIYR